jgi:hypothetical protein
MRKMGEWRRAIVSAKKKLEGFRQFEHFSVVGSSRSTTGPSLAAPMPRRPY